MRSQQLMKNTAPVSLTFVAAVLLLCQALVMAGPAEGQAAQRQATRQTTGAKATPPSHPWRSGRGKLTPPTRSLAGKAQQGDTQSQQVKLKKGMALLNFSDAGIKDVVMTISRITGKNFILSPEVMGRKITIRTTRPIPKKDVFGIFETMLAVNGLSAVRAGSYYTIVPTRAARQRGLALYSTRDGRKIPRSDRMINLLVPIKFISANDVAQILKPSISPGGNVAVYPKANTLIITERATNAKKFLDLINKLDVDLFDKLNVSLIHVNNVDVSTMAKELLDIFKVLGYGKETSQFYTIPIERFNSLIVFSSSKELLASAEKWIRQLDQASTTNEVSTHIYYVKNDKASNIKDMLDKLYGTAEDSEKTTGANAGAEAGGQTTDKANPAAATKAAPAKSKTSPASRSFSGKSNGLDIFIYEPSNAIIVRSSQRDYQMVLKTIHELDRPPKQVLIDALVVEVALDESTKYGIQWSAITGNVSLQNNTGLFSTTLDAPTSAVSTPIGLAAVSGLNVLATDSKNFFGFLQAFASEGKVNVLSNPHILVQNYAKASISVGSDEPIATQSTQTAVTTTASLIQSIEYRRTGIILTVTPHITEGGMVAMTLHQEISDVSTSRTVGDGTFPSFTNREAETSVIIKNGQTIAIGGLIDTKKNKTHSGIPLLSKIPLLGNLFKFTSLTKDRTELVILLTPRVISNNADALSATDDLEYKLSGLRDFLMKTMSERKHKKEGKEGK
jgi:general secretion pathway protein D